ncbi:hypothetical protein [Paucilactobacillus suebicus]|uniref:Integral membrane protein n=2 Tax=Paucilactobacillus suebicus TaxID=152335 RepID=A0A0R1W5S0_9LACO|nr:hypothetical protein [Paucilactobacillus suebicus]KRM13134.1 hypothetical protein FD16_GL001278 [Paucilactobacillus suebicus DSM 5007 = KCTC 3549]
MNLSKIKIVGVLIFFSISLMASFYSMLTNQSSFLVSPFWIMFGAITLILVTRIMYVLINRMNTRIKKIVLAVVLLLIFLTQLWFSFNFVDYGRADSFFVRNQAMALVKGTTKWANYFYVYKNNVNYVYLLVYILKFVRIFSVNYVWQSVNIIQFVWIDMALLAGIKIFHYWKMDTLKIIFAIFWLFSVPLYAYGLFVYSDAFVIPVPIITFALWIYFDTNVGYKKYASFAVMVLLDIFSTLIKPNMIVLLIAVGIMIVTKLIKKQWSSKNLLTSVIISIVCIFIGIGTFQLENHVYDYQARPNEELPATSWIAMSLNPNTNGEYDYQDAHYQMSLQTKTRKETSEKKIIKDRIKNMGFIGLAQHLLKKSFVFTSSGTFDSLKLTTQWEKEPSWYLYNQDIVNSWISLISQIFLVFLFISSAFSFLSTRNQDNNGLAILIALGLSSFHIIFWEVEPRYAVPLLPILMLWSVSSFSNSEVFSRLVIKKKIFFSGIVTLALLSTFGNEFKNSNVVKKDLLVAEQGDGRYFDNEMIDIKPNQTISSNIVTHSNSSNIELVSGHIQVPVKVVIKHDGKIIKKEIGSSTSINNISYASQKAGVLNVSVKNLSNRDLKLGGVQSSYPVGEFHVKNMNDTYLRYYVKSVATSDEHKI